MVDESSTARWRETPVIPTGYDDIASLVGIARKARGRMVEFDWAFSSEDLRRVRRAVYEWGRQVTGRYRGFDARVLAVINEALGETHTTYSLSESARTAFDGEVACVNTGDLYRLRGHAPFDIVFGYGMAGSSNSGVKSMHLGPTAQHAFASAVTVLGWDLKLLQEERFKPVLNALYGNPLDLSVVQSGPASGPVTEVPIHFHGAFSAQSGNGRCLFVDDIGHRTGIYLWTINIDGKECPWYVGQTRRGFRQRMAEHLRSMLSGEYPPYDPAALARGEHKRAQGGVNGQWPSTLPSFLLNYEALAPNIITYIRQLKFHLAPVDGDAHLHNRIEGGLGRYLKEHADPLIRDFFFPGIRVPAVIPYDNPIRIVLSSDVSINGLPADLSI